MRSFDYEAAKAPDFFQENRERPHSDHCYVLGDGSDPCWSLNGPWYFHYAESCREAIPGFQAPEVDCRGWDTIPVPSHIQLQGYGRPQYVNIQYPWDGSEALMPGQVPERYNPVGSYVKYFVLPEYMAGKRIFISFQGAESGLAVWCNGQYVGYGEDGFTPSEFELTPYLRPGENKLAAQVFQFTAASWCEDQDFFRFSGLFREVYLYAVPAVHVRDLKITTNLSGDFARAQVRLAMEAWGSGAARCRLYDGESLTAERTVTLGEAAELPVERPRLWSAENPALYRLEIAVLDDRGETTEVITEQVGLRRFEIRNGVMELNGRRILLRGVNRHEFSAERGRCVTEEETEKDILTMKRHNINAIRTSHYPNQSFFYRLCDRYGMYVLDEMNLESHGSWGMMDAGLIPLERHVPGDDPQWREAVVARAAAMYQRDKNHPSVLIWSCGNESYGGTNLLEASRYFHRMDTRPVHYEGATVDLRHPEISDLFSNMYWPAEAIREALERDSSKPAISCEYGHAMGNSFGNQQRYIQLADEVPAYQGGFIWDYIDQALTTKDCCGREFQGYGGDFGDRPNDGNFSGNGLVYSKDRSPSPKLREVKYLYQGLQVRIDAGQAEIANRYLFTNSCAFDCVAQLWREGALLAESPMETAVAPGERETYPLPLWPEKLDGEYTVIVSFRLRKDESWAPAGHEVAFGQWTGGAPAEPARPESGPEVVDGAWNLGVSGPDFRILFSKLHGGLVSYRYRGKELLKSQPRPNFWRAPTDNDRGCFAPARYAQWKIASLYSTAKEIPGVVPGWGRKAAWTVEHGDNWVQITYSHLLPTTPQGTCDLRYRVFSDGTVETALHTDAAKILGPMPEFGLLLEMDAGFRHVRWYGPGPEETYCDRKLGSKLGVYENLVEENMAAYLKPQECGNKTDVRWASVTDDSGTGLLFRGDQMEFSALPYTPWELENAAHPHELPPICHTVVRVAAKQMGLAGDDSWGAMPAPEYLLPAGEMTFSFTFRGVEREER